MTAFLPQFDAKPSTRQSALEKARSNYQYNYTHVSPLALVNELPFEEEFSEKWMFEVSRVVLVALKNRLELEWSPENKESIWAKIRDVEEGLSLGASLISTRLDGLITEFLRLETPKADRSNHAKSLEDFASMFTAIGLPPVNAKVGNDLHFAEMRLAGPNPVMLERISRLDDRFPFSEAEFQLVVPGDSLAAAGAEGRLFFADYRVLSHIEGSQTVLFELQKYLFAPMALFVVDRVSRQLRPVAIQCRQTPGPDNPIFTPDDGPNWMIAKTTVEIADGNVHESSTHLGRTHFLIEPFVISTFRQLAPNHPLFLLLVPHFEGTLRINRMAWKYLIQDGGVVDRLLGGTIEESRGLAASGLRSVSVSESSFSQSLRSRGVDDRTWLANYPYRDDAQLYWDAIAGWVLDYLNLYYPSDEEVGRDAELLAWMKELGSKDGGRLPGFEQAPTPTIASLAQALTFVIFTASVQHAAVNFPQYSLMSYVPAMPLAAYAKTPKTKKGGTEQDFLKFLPPLDLSQLQMDTGYVLGSVHYTTLGHYAHDHFTDPRVETPLKKFQGRLDEIGGEIEMRNTIRTPYQFLTRSGIPQSINI